jgi:hypothetical protein
MRGSASARSGVIIVLDSQLRLVCVGRQCRRLTWSPDPDDGRAALKSRTRGLRESRYTGCALRAGPQEAPATDGSFAARCQNDAAPTGGQTNEREETS